MKGWKRGASGGFSLDEGAVSKGKSSVSRSWGSVPEV